MAGLNTASILNKRLFCTIMMTSVVLDGEDKSTQAPFNEVGNWAQKLSDQTVGAIPSEQRVKCIAISTRDNVASVNKIKDCNVVNIGVAPVDHAARS